MLVGCREQQQKNPRWHWRGFWSMNAHAVEPLTVKHFRAPFSPTNMCLVLLLLLLRQLLLLLHFNILGLTLLGMNWSIHIRGYPRIAPEKLWLNWEEFVDAVHHPAWRIKFNWGGARDSTERGEVCNAYACSSAVAEYLRSVSFCSDAVKHNYWLAWGVCHCLPARPFEQVVRPRRQCWNWEQANQPTCSRFEYICFNDSTVRGEYD